MSFAKLKDKTVDELREELLALRQTQLKLRIQNASKQLTQTHLISQVRRDIARVKMLLAKQNVKV